MGGGQVGSGTQGNALELNLRKTRISGNLGSGHSGAEAGAPAGMCCRCDFEWLVRTPVSEHH